MNKLLQDKLDQLENASEYECWYLVKQPTEFDKLCYLVAILKEYQQSKIEETLDAYITRRVQEITEGKPALELSNNYRALRVAAFFGLITLKSSRYNDAAITPAFEEINSRCAGEFEKVELYSDLIQRQIEKMFLSSVIDEGSEGTRKAFRLYPIMLLYKVLLELGRATGSFSITLNEYRYLVATTPRYEQFLDTLLLIHLLRMEPEANDEFEKYKTKFDNRLILAIKQLPSLSVDRNKISMNEEAVAEISEKIFAFEQNPGVFTTDHYLEFLGSTDSLVDLATYNIEKAKTLLLETDAQQSKEYTLDELVDILKKMCADGEAEDKKIAALYNFGIKYGKQILDKNYKLTEIVVAAGLQPSYDRELQKAVKIYTTVKDGDFGIRFVEDCIVVRNCKNPMSYETGYVSEFSRNRIVFGAPGTGKSHTLEGDRKELLYGNREVDEKKLDLTKYGAYERVTFHPDYSYANFVGTYKPVPSIDKAGNEIITYQYVAGPFMRTYVKAMKNSKTDSIKPYLLLIEEINRANVAAVFGDVFQLLDRDANNISEYPIQTSEDIRNYLAKPENLGGVPSDYETIRIPDNMFIWASMNSADQGVFPMDTAFKRRWDFTYMGIDNGAEKISGKTVVLGKGENKRIVEWDALRKAINEELVSYKVNEDKLMGPFFLSKKIIPETGEINQKTFIEAFKNKVIMYLFDDAAKQKYRILFGGCEDKAKNQYSKICEEFDKKGVFIFCDTISNRFIDKVPEDEGK